MTIAADLKTAQTTTDASVRASLSARYVVPPALSLVLIAGQDRAAAAAAFEAAVRSLGTCCGEVILVTELGNPSQETELMGVVKEKGGVLVVAPAGADRALLSKLGVAAARGDVIAVRDTGGVGGFAWMSELLRAWGGDRAVPRLYDNVPSQTASTGSRIVAQEVASVSVAADSKGVQGLAFQ